MRSFFRTIRDICGVFLDAFLFIGLCFRPTAAVEAKIYFSAANSACSWNGRFDLAGPPIRFASSWPDCPTSLITVRRYMPKKPPRSLDPKQRWKTFVRNHPKAIIASDFCVVLTATFQLVYMFVIIEVASRRVLHFNVTQHPSAEWTLQQFRECVTGDEGYRYVIHDRDRIYSSDLDAALKSMGLTVLGTPYKSPQANAVCERFIGTARRECLDYMIPLNEGHVRQILKGWLAHYNHGRPHSVSGREFPNRSVPT
jgi:transposase InsO family protein